MIPRYARRREEKKKVHLASLPLQVFNGGPHQEEVTTAFGAKTSPIPSAIQV